MANQGAPAASFKFNQFQEIKSHSSILFNERLAILFYILDTRSIDLNTTYSVPLVLEVRAILKQIYKNIRTLIRNNPTVRATLNLETKDPGIYITDFSLGAIDKMIEHCEINGYTTRKIYIIVQELNNFEMIVKDVLQYFHYFIRPDFRQKPDIEVATEKYKEIADERTIEELKEIVGKNNRIDFEGLGTSRIEFNFNRLDNDDMEDDSDLLTEDEDNDGDEDNTDNKEENSI